MIASHIKKEEQNSELIDIHSYLQLCTQKKQKILDYALKLEKEHSFLPNTHLSGS
jgi:hypothetical protein